MITTAKEARALMLQENENRRRDWAQESFRKLMHVIEGKAQDGQYSLNIGNSLSDVTITLLTDAGFSL